MICNFSPFPILTTKRLVLRQITLDDDNEIFYERSDKLINKYLDRPLATSIDEAKEWIARITAIMENGEGITWGLTLKVSNTLMGGFCFWNLNHERNSGEIGFSLHPQHWGKGLMSEALTACIRFGFQVMQLGNIEAYTQPGNISSVKLLEKHGFKRKPELERADDPYAVFALEHPLYSL